MSGVGALADGYLSTTDFRIFERHGPGDRYLELAAACWETRAFGDFWQYCLVAEGSIDLAVDPVANPWDLAAVQPLVTEAGGTFTDLAGVARFDGGNALASNGALHDAALAIIGTTR